jgi:lipopolysaccharide export system permease protein
VRRLDRYLFTEVMLPYLAAQGAFVVMFIGTDALTEATKLVSRYGLPWPGVAAMILLRIPWAIGWTMPMSVGMAVILAVGRICKDVEYAPMIMGGLSFRRMMVPMCLFAGIVSGVALWIEEYLGPETMQRYYVRKQQLQTKATGDQFEVHMRLNDLDQPRRITLTARTLDPRQQMLKDVELMVWEQDKLPQRLIIAHTATWDPDPKDKHWVLHDAYIYNFDAEGRPRLALTCATWAVRPQGELTVYGEGIVFEDDPNTINVASSDKPDYLTYEGIRTRIRYMVAHKETERDVNRVRIYLYRRWTLASSCLVFVIVGAPLAVRPQRGANLSTAFAIGLVLILGYYMVWNATSFLGEGSHQPWVWAWSSNILGVVAGLLLFRRVPD